MLCVNGYREQGPDRHISPYPNVGITYMMPLSRIREWNNYTSRRSALSLDVLDNRKAINRMLKKATQQGRSE